MPTAGIRVHATVLAKPGPYGSVVHIFQYVRGRLYVGDLHPQFCLFPKLVLPICQPAPVMLQLLRVVRPHVTSDPMGNVPEQMLANVPCFQEHVAATWRGIRLPAAHIRIAIFSVVAPYSLNLPVRIVYSDLRGAMYCSHSSRQSPVGCCTATSAPEHFSLNCTRSLIHNEASRVNCRQSLFGLAFPGRRRLHGKGMKPRHTVSCTCLG